MKITESNIDKLPEKEQAIVKSLLSDLKEINDTKIKLPIDLHWIDQHTEYSPERTDPCPDYYGMYVLRWGTEFVGVEMDLDTLDTVLCALYNYVVDCE